VRMMVILPKILQICYEHYQHNFVEALVLLNLIFQG